MQSSPAGSLKAPSASDAGNRPTGRPEVSIDLVRGIRLLPIEEGQPRPYGCEWSHNGKRPSRFFRTIADLETHIREIKSAMAKKNLDVMPTAGELREWRAFKLGAAGVPSMTILVEWRAMRENQGRPPCSKSVSECVTEYLDEQEVRERRGAIGRDTLRQKRCKLEHFRQAFASVVLDAVTPQQIEAWIDNMEQVETDSTFNDYRKRVSEFFSHFAESVPKNPVNKIEVRGSKTGLSDRHNVRLYSVAQTEAILAYAAKAMPYLLPRLAAEVFVGLRFTTASLLQRQHINEHTRIFDLPRAIMKTRKDHLIDEAPPAYWLWAKLGIEDSRCWSLSATDYMHAKSAVLEGAGIALEQRKRNALRKGFASYHLAAFSKPGLTAKIMAHISEAQLWGTYREKATGTDGRRLFSLRPTKPSKLTSRHAGAET